MKKETLKYGDTRGLKIFAQSIINHKESHVHSVQEVIISKECDFYALVNTKTLKINAFDTEQEALNHLLDYYPSLGSEQKELF